MQLPAGNEFLLRAQDKGNGFIFLDKKTNKEEASEQIRTSNFLKKHFDPTSWHIQKVKQFSQKWARKGDLSKEWASFIVNINEQLGKNITLYKTHKQNIQIRLLTTGCNTAIENPAIFVEKHQMRTYQQK